MEKRCFKKIGRTQIVAHNEAAVNRTYIVWETYVNCEDSLILFFHTRVYLQINEACIFPVVFISYIFTMRCKRYKQNENCLIIRGQHTKVVISHSLIDRQMAVPEYSDEKSCIKNKGLIMRPWNLSLSCHEAAIPFSLNIIYWLSKSIVASSTNSKSKLNVTCK